MVSPRMTRVEEKQVSRGQPRPTSQRAGPQRPQIIWDPYLCPNGLTWSDKIWCADTRGSSVFIGESHAPYPKAQRLVKNLETPTCMHTVRETTNKFCVGIRK